MPGSAYCESFHCHKRVPPHPGKKDKNWEQPKEINGFVLFGMHQILRDLVRLSAWYNLCTDIESCHLNTSTCFFWAYKGRNVCIIFVGIFFFPSKGLRLYSHKLVKFFFRYLIYGHSNKATCLAFLTSTLACGHWLWHPQFIDPTGSILGRSQLLVSAFRQLPCRTRVPRPEDVSPVTDQIVFAFCVHLICV